MRILLAVDRSHSSAAPIREAAERSWPAGTTFRVLTVLEAMPPAAYVPEVPLVPLTDPLEMMEEEQHAKGMLASIREMLRPSGHAIETQVRRGSAGRAIVEEAQRWGAELILVGSHGRTGLRRAVMGSVAQYVVAHAKCSVEVVREGAPLDADAR